MIAIEFEDYFGSEVVVALSDYLLIAFGGRHDVHLYWIAGSETKSASE